MFMVVISVIALFIFYEFAKTIYWIWSAGKF
jgi:hypothetical protein